MIPPELLKKIREIEIRTRRLVSESLAGQYHSVFKGQGMDFDEVREYQPGDEVRAIDWNVTARMNQPFIKKFVEERELTVMLVVDVSGSGLFGSGSQSKRELAAEIASILAFSAIRNNDKVGLILHTDEIEKFIRPGKGRRHVLRVIREILYCQPEHTGTDLAAALEFLGRVTRRRSVSVVISDFIESHTKESNLSAETLQALRQVKRKHDLIAVRTTDRREQELPALGRLTLRDAETGETVEVHAGSTARRKQFASARKLEEGSLSRELGALGIDTLSLRAGEPYTRELTRFFQTREKRIHHA